MADQFPHAPYFSPRHKDRKRKPLAPVAGCSACNISPRTARRPNSSACSARNSLENLVVDRHGRRMVAAPQATHILDLHIFRAGPRKSRRTIPRAVRTSHSAGNSYPRKREFPLWLAALNENEDKNWRHCEFDRAEFGCAAKVLAILTQADSHSAVGWLAVRQRSLWACLGKLRRVVRQCSGALRRSPLFPHTRGQTLFHKFCPRCLFAQCPSKSQRFRLTCPAIGRYKQTELSASYSMTTKYSVCFSRATLLLAALFCLFARGNLAPTIPGARQIHRPRFLRGHQLPRQRQAGRRQPHPAKRIFHLDFAGQAQSRISGPYRRSWRTHGAHPEARHKGGRIAQVPRRATRFTPRPNSAAAPLKFPKVFLANTAMARLRRGLAPTPRAIGRTKNPSRKA